MALICKSCKEQKQIVPLKFVEREKDKKDGKSYNVFRCPGCDRVLKVLAKTGN